MSKKLLKIILYSNKPVCLTKDVDRRSYNDNSDAKRTDPNLTYRLTQLKDCIFEKHVYRIPLSLIVDLSLVNFSFKTDTKIILMLERNMNKLFESHKKVTAIPENPDVLIQFHDRPYISYQEINLTKGADICCTGILRSETALSRVFYLPHTNNFSKLIQAHSLTLAHSRERKDNLIGLKFLSFIISHFNTQLFTIVMI